jgi:hypothetical protein
MIQQITAFADSHFIPWWRQSWRDGSTIAITLLSALATFMADNSGVLLSLVDFVPDGQFRFASLIGIFLSLFVPSLLAKLWNQPRPGVEPSVKPSPDAPPTA